MLMMLLQNSPSLLEQLGGGATLIQKELERREKVEKMNVRALSICQNWPARPLPDQSV